MVMVMVMVMSMTTGYPAMIRPVGIWESHILLVLRWWIWQDHLRSVGLLWCKDVQVQILVHILHVRSWGPPVYLPRLEVLAEKEGRRRRKKRPLNLSLLSLHPANLFFFFNTTSSHAYIRTYSANPSISVWPPMRRGSYSVFLWWLSRSSPNQRLIFLGHPPLPTAVGTMTSPIGRLGILSLSWCPVGG